MAVLKIGLQGRTGKVGPGTILVLNRLNRSILMQEGPGGDFFRWDWGMDGDDERKLPPGFPRTDEAFEWLATTLARSHGLMAMESKDWPGLAYQFVEPRY